MKQCVVILFALVLGITLCPSSVLANMASDSGQHTCYNATQAIPCPAPNTPFFGQDANVSYAPVPYEIHGPIVRDTVTGLSWQRSSDSQRRSYEDARAYCAQLTLEKETGWRLPSLHELFTIIDYGRINPSLPPEFFPTSMSVWAADSVLDETPQAYVVSFETGMTQQARTLFFMNTRCVKGTPLSGGPYIDHGRSIEDQSTGLMWLEVDEAPATWEQALAFCDALYDDGNDDWRLPNVRELTWILDTSQTPVALPLLFTSTGNQYWTSTTETGSPQKAWLVQCETATTSTIDKSQKIPFRCVRGGKTFFLPDELLSAF